MAVTTNKAAKTEGMTWRRYKDGESEKDRSRDAVHLGSPDHETEGEHGQDRVSHRVDDGQAIEELAWQFARESDNGIDEPEEERRDSQPDAESGKRAMGVRHTEPAEVPRVGDQRIANAISIG